MQPRILRAQTLHTADEVVADSRLVGLTSEGWQFDAVGGKQRAAKEVVHWGGRKAFTKKQAIWLVDGSWLCGEVGFASANELSLESDWFSCPSIPLASVRAIVNNPPASFAKWRRLIEDLNVPADDQDRVWLASGKQLRGILQWSFEESAAKQQGYPALKLESAGQQIDIDWNSIDVFLASPALVGKVPTSPVGEDIGLADGTFLSCKQVQVRDGTVNLLLRGGLSLETYDSASEFTETITLLASHETGVQFLSDLEVASYKNLSQSSLTWELGRDSDVLRRPLAVDEGVVEKGLAMHSASQVAYRWDGTSARLLAEVVFADPPANAVNAIGSVRCKVLLARDGKLESVFDSALERNVVGQQSALVDVDLTDARLIVLVVEEARFGQLGDHVQWLAARVSAGK